MAQLLSGDDRDFLLLVELLVELLVLASDFFNVDETLVLSKHLQEVHGALMERCDGGEHLIQLADLLQSNTTILREVTEHLRVSVKIGQVHHILVHIIQRLFLGGSREKHVSVSALNGVFIAGCLVVWGALNPSHITKREWLKQLLVQIECDGKFLPRLAARIVVLGVGLLLHWLVTSLILAGTIVSRLLLFLLGEVPSLHRDNLGGTHVGAEQSLGSQSG